MASGAVDAVHRLPACDHFRSRNRPRLLREVRPATSTATTCRATASAASATGGRGLLLLSEQHAGRKRTDHYETNPYPHLALFSLLRVCLRVSASGLR